MAFPDFLDLPSDEAAPKLLGCILECDLDGVTVRARIVETESYDQTDEASHSFRGKTQRTAVMFGPSGHLYVYFTYGMHYCCNVVTGIEGEGSAVLIRAVEPLDHTELLELRRGKKGVAITNGPAKVCHALGIEAWANGHDLHQYPIRLVAGTLQPDERIVRTIRIGISHARDELRRYYIADNPYVSRQ